MSGFTPGQWMVDPDNCMQVVSFAHGHEIIVAETFTDDCPECTVDVAKADTRLIAAAPRMYEALKRAQEELRLIRMKDCDRVYDVALRIEIASVLTEIEGKSNV